MATTLLITDATGKPRKIDIAKGQTTRIPAEKQMRIEVVDESLQTPPKQLKGRRVGDDLELLTDDTPVTASQPVANVVVIENFYATDATSLYAGAGEQAVAYPGVQNIASGADFTSLSPDGSAAALLPAPLLSPMTAAVVGGLGLAAAAASGGGSNSTPNKVPVATFKTAQVATEDGPKVTGQLTATDGDAGAQLTYAQAGTPVAGLTINADGAWTFDPSNTAYQSLAAGEKKSITVTYKVTDDRGDSATESFVITVTGVNDAPVATASTVSVLEGKTVSGNVQATDADAGTKLTYALLQPAPVGLTFKADGSYTFDASNTAYDSMAAGEKKVLTVQFKANDGTVDSAPQTLGITVIGANDVALITGTTTGSVTEDALTLSAAGTLTVTDVDTGEAIFKAPAASALQGQYGAFTFDNSTGQWGYEADNAHLQPLAAGATAQDVLTVTTADGTTQKIVVSLHGMNDAPVFQVANDDVAAVQLTEDPSNAVTASGTLSVSDVDTPSGTYTISKVGVAVDSQYKLLTGVQSDDDSTLAKFLAMMTLTSTPNQGTGKLVWSFDSTLASALDAIPQDEVLKLEYEITANDGQGGQTTQLVVVAITGTNDAPKVQIRAGDSYAGTVTDAQTNVTGSLTIIDEDAVAAYYAGVSFDGVAITDATLLATLNGFFGYDSTTSTFQSKNENNNFDWIFLTADAMSAGLTTGLSAGTHVLTYHMAFEDAYQVRTSQDINISFQV
jgi:VCBS repeat-containing protein